MDRAQLVEKLLNDGNGTLFASVAVREGLPRSELSRMARLGELDRVERGVYVRAGELDDEMYSLQRRARKIVYSHESALFLHGLTDRTPILHSITVPNAYKPSSALKARCRVFYVRPELIGLGKMPLPTGMGHEVISYDRERTMCDVLRSREKMDRQIVIDALKRYVAANPDLNRLSEYGGKFGIRGVLRQYLEVLL